MSAWRAYHPLSARYVSNDDLRLHRHFEKIMNNKTTPKETNKGFIIFMWILT